MKLRIIKLTILLAALVITSSVNIPTLTQGQEAEEQWDFGGVMKVESDEEYMSLNSFPIRLFPTDEGLNDSVNGIDRPLLYFEVMGLDTDEDEKMDIYFGFYGVNFFDTSVHGYNTSATNLFQVTVNIRWRFRIPEEAVARGVRWQILYYGPELQGQLYSYLSIVLEYNSPIYYVNLTEQEGTNLEYRIDYGLNYTLGNFTTFGAGRPLIPDMPTFPGYNVSVPLFTKNDIREELLKTDFFGSTLGFVTIITLSFMIIHTIRKRRTRKRALA